MTINMILIAVFIFIVALIVGYFIHRANEQEYDDFYNELYGEDCDDN